MGPLSRLLDFLRDPHYGTPPVTLTGQRVRSKGEKIIADYLTRHNISYQYEAQAKTNDWFIFKKTISRPDFYLPQYDLYVEYWGLVDSINRRTKDRYTRTMRWKMAQYYKNNIHFVSIYPSKHLQP